MYIMVSRMLKVRTKIVPVIIGVLEAVKVDWIRTFSWSQATYKPKN